MNAYMKKAMIGLAGMLIAAGPVAGLASAREVQVGHTDHNWAIQIAGNQVNPGETWEGEVKLNLSGLLAYRTAEATYFADCPTDIAGYTDVRVTVENNGRYWVECF
jgi:hypothetical protein